MEAAVPGHAQVAARAFQEEGSADAVRLGRATKNMSPSLTFAILCLRSPRGSLWGQRGGALLPVGPQVLYHPQGLALACPVPKRPQGCGAGWPGLCAQLGGACSGRAV